MKTRGLIITLLAMACAFASQSLHASNPAPAPKDGGKGQAFVAKLISPRPGEVVYPGQEVRIQWEAQLPDVNLSWCEVEIYLSVDGGRTNIARMTPQLDPRVGFYTWIVPNMPTAAAVLDIHFGCEGYFAETPSVQSQSAFVIGQNLRLLQAVAITSVSAAQALPGQAVQVSWESSVQKVDHFELQISYDRGAHFNPLANTRELQSTWYVPSDFAGHATFRVVAHTAGDKHVDSVVTAEPQVIVRARAE